jgi:hypothetical protein
MTNDLEDMARRLPLRQPPPSLDRWVRARMRRRRLTAAALAAAAAAAVAAALWVVAHPIGPGPLPGRPGEAAPADLTPVRVERICSRTFDGGTVLLGSGKPYRLLRRETVRFIRWRDAGPDGSREIALPRRTIILVPEEPY